MAVHLQSSSTPLQGQVLKTLNPHQTFRNIFNGPETPSKAVPDGLGTAGWALAGLSGAILGLYTLAIETLCWKWLVMHECSETCVPLEEEGAYKPVLQP